jgi:hypothetical protein
MPNSVHKCLWDYFNATGEECSAASAYKPRMVAGNDFLFFEENVVKHTSVRRADSCRSR